MSKSKRIVWIDIAKGICMLAIIAGHLGVVEVNRIVYAFHCTLFFILSGYTLKPETSTESVSKRFSQLMFPYLVTCAAVIVMNVVNLVIVDKVTSNVAVTHSIYTDIVRSFFGSGAFTNFGKTAIGGRIGAIWFLPAIFFASVFSRFLLKYVKDIRVRYAISISAATLSFVSGSFAWFPFSVQSAIFAIPFMLLGYDAKNSGAFEKLRLSHFLLSLGIFVVGFFAEFTTVSFVTASMSDFIFTPVFALAASVCVIYISQKIEFIKPLAFIGKYSVYYLCIHLFEMETMGRWFIKLLTVMHLPVNALTMFTIRIIFSTLMTFALIGIGRLITLVRKEVAVQKNRDPSLDIAKALLIIIMILGHFSVDRGYRNIIYSFHMPAFILLSGYMFKPKACDNLLRSVLRLIKSFLVPYAVFAVGYVIVRPGDIATKLTSLIMGISYTKNIFTDVIGIGVAWFILLLFAVRLVYLFLYKFIKNELMLNGAVLFLTLAGFLLGKYGYWLPWSFDVALYSIVFYHIGYYIKKYNILDYLAKRPYFYFLLTPIWGYAIFTGAIELSVRAYREFGIAIVGAVCATALIYMLSRFIHTSGGKIINAVLSAIGRNTMYILLIHSLFGSLIITEVPKYSGLTNGYIYHMAVVLILNIVAGTVLGLVIDLIKKALSSFKAK